MPRIRLKPLAGGLATFLIGWLLPLRFPSTSSLMQVFLWLVALGLVCYAIEGWLRRYVLPHLPDQWMAREIRNAWRWFLYKPIIQFTWDVEISNNKPQSLFPILDIASRNPYGQTICDFSNAYIDVKQKRKKFRFYNTNEDAKIYLETMETELKRFMYFRSRDDDKDCDFTVNFCVLLRGVEGRIYDAFGETGAGAIAGIRGARRLEGARNG